MGFSTFAFSPIPEGKNQKSEMRIAVTVLVFCVAALLSLGMVMLYSSSMTQVGAHYLIMQLIWCVLGLGLCFTAAAMDYRLLKKIAWPLLAFAAILLAMVLVPHLYRFTHFVDTPRINGARRWFDLR